MKLWKVYRQTDVLTDRQHVIRKAHLDLISSGELTTIKNTLLLSMHDNLFFLYFLKHEKENNLTVSYKTTCKYTRFMDKT